MNFSIKKSLDTLGRIVIPKNLREYYDIKLGEELSLVPTEDGILIVKKKGDKKPSKEA